MFGCGNEDCQEEHYEIVGALERERDAAIARAEASMTLASHWMDRAVAAEARVRELEAIVSGLHSRLHDALTVRAMQWRPISEYDAMKEKPFHRVFGRKVGKLGMAWDVIRHVEDTHFLQLPPVPGEEWCGSG